MAASKAQVPVQAPRRFLQPMGSPVGFQTMAGTPVVQRMISGLQIGSDPQRVVTVPSTGAAWGHRPPTNASGQQSHRTAYLLFQEMVRTAIHRQDWADAANNLSSLLNSFKDLDGIDNARADLQTAITENMNNLTDRPKLRSDAKKLLSIAAYNALAIRQSIPGSVGTGSREGHGESDMVGRLRVYESYIEQNNALPTGGSVDEISTLMWRLLDWNPTANERQEMVERIVWNHLKTVAEAFPETMGWLAGSNHLLIPWLRTHRNVAGMPMPRIGDQTLANVQTQVHANW